jgi:hypothetical protein
MMYCHLLEAFLTFFDLSNLSDVSHDKISRDKAAFAVRDSAVAALKETYSGFL